MTDQNLASLPPIELIRMLNIAQANYLNAKSDRDAVDTFADSLIGGWEFDYSAYIGDALDRLADAKVLSR